MATGEAHNSRLRMVITVVIGLLIAIVPLPDTLRPWRPDFLLLLVIYWSLSAPRIAGLSFAWLSGLLIDVLSGTILGQHALAFLLVAFLTHKFQLRMRIFPIWHQTLTVFMLLALYQFVVFWIDGIVGPGITTWLRWLPVLTGALAWPILVAVLDTWNRRRS
jgi:rod shape-determining protein MreD